ncbi:hypothetical protein A4C53_RS10890 [Elizabethkingia anophelis]|uniref:Bacteriocin n=1 Tax=Elizabethkingia bruuniana TaxID=1756149 RepID=A0A7T7V1P2_9FLAO|nr:MULTISPECIES: hypothetical protein [Elizabethkingia]KGO09114.1 hypothetical protein KS04_16645 [Elizabethkingia miricola]AMR42771.1 hypothetical protein A2T74_16040 [Elizabethkingia anophelis]AMX49414.1 hypothetical protein A4C56_16040 [Elizabethkingia anophelis]AMX52869.1 hypothetical protein A2T72_16035 [Elizabethkingia anophelis]AMX56263.1 hypothetical protein A2T59_16040 [Elizabethkingia anophelis]
MKNLKRLSRADLKNVAGGAACSEWYRHTAECGASYGLCFDNYRSINDMQDAVKELDSIKCS